MRKLMGEVLEQGCQTQILSRANYALGFGLEGHKFLKDLVDYNNHITISTNQTKGNGYKLELKTFNTTQCGNCLICKLANTRNRLPARYLIR